MGMDLIVEPFPKSLELTHILPFELTGVISKQAKAFRTKKNGADLLHKEVSALFSHNQLPNQTDLGLFKRLVDVVDARFSDQELPRHTYLSLIAAALGYKTYASLLAAAELKLETQEEREAKLLPSILWFANAVGLADKVSVEVALEVAAELTEKPAFFVKEIPVGPFRFEAQGHFNGTLTWEMADAVYAYPLSDLGVAPVKHRTLLAPAVKPSFEEYAAMPSGLQMLVLTLAWLKAGNVDASGLNLENQYALVKSHYDGYAAFVLHNEQYVGIHGCESIVLWRSERGMYAKPIPKNASELNGTANDTVIPVPGTSVSFLPSEDFLRGVFSCQMVRSMQLPVGDPRSLRMYHFTADVNGKVVNQVASVCFKPGQSFYIPEELEPLFAPVQRFFRKNASLEAHPLNLTRLLLKLAKEECESHL